jgi:hypothetical protein
MMAPVGQEPFDEGDLDDHRARQPRAYGRPDDRRFGFRTVTIVIRQESQALW